jgi:hypothetical protein
MLKKFFIAGILLLPNFILALGQNDSYYPIKPVDSSAIYFEPSNFEIFADGEHNDSYSLQAAIDRVVDLYGTGILFIPSGTYLLEHTIHVWRGVKLIGYGPTRPVFLVKENSPGCQSEQRVYLIHFHTHRPSIGVPPGDANAGTFYTGLSNINFLIEEGNPSLAAVRFHVAQHSSIEYVDFHLKSGVAAIEQIGNEIEDCRFFGGEYGIKTKITAPSWQSLIMDCHFEGQKRAAILTQEAGLSITGCTFNNVPTGIEIYENQIEKLYIENSQFRRIEKWNILLSRPQDPANQLNLIDVGCENASNLLGFRDEGEPIQIKEKNYLVETLSHGWMVLVDAEGKVAKKMDLVLKYHQEKSLPAPKPTCPLLPPMNSWVNICDLGAKGDGETDNTSIFQDAISKHQAIYIPSGKYVISNTLHLKKNTVLIGLHCFNTNLILKSNTTGFSDPDNPKPIIVSPKNGTNILTGLSINPGYNKGAIQLKWMSGENSMVDDVYFEMGARGERNRHHKGEDILYSLWVCDGGGGIIKNCWTANILSQSGLRIENTDTPGSIYQISVEHHNDFEVQIENVQNWKIVNLQTEENIGSENAISVDMSNSQNIRFANYFAYRVMSIQESHPYAMRLRQCNDVQILGGHIWSYGQKPFENMVTLPEIPLDIPDPEIARFKLD